MIGAVSAASARTDLRVLGKPGSTLIDLIREDLCCQEGDRENQTEFTVSTPSENPDYKDSSGPRLCMVGDRLDTDIEFGNLYGLTTILVLSGVTDRAEVESLVSKVNKSSSGTVADDEELRVSRLRIPDYVMEGVADFFG